MMEFCAPESGVLKDEPKARRGAAARRAVLDHDGPRRERSAMGSRGGSGLWRWTSSGAKFGGVGAL
ncbi:MAG: hypothetical protein JWO33_333 [Caulobacteraceae bacterium]|nr:hypothetical protein [Caulobacteraceae bacterium]